MLFGYSQPMAGIPGLQERQALARAELARSLSPGTIYGPGQLVAQLGATALAAKGYGGAQEALNTGYTGLRKQLADVLSNSNPDQSGVDPRLLSTLDQFSPGAGSDAAVNIAMQHPFMKYDLAGKKMALAQELASTNYMRSLQGQQPLTESDIYGQGALPTGGAPPPNAGSIVPPMSGAPTAPASAAAPAAAPNEYARLMALSVQAHAFGQHELGKSYQDQAMALPDYLKQKSAAEASGALPSKLTAAWNSPVPVAPGGAVVNPGGMPETVAGVIGTESSGNPAAVSPAGAVGLMQLTPDAAKEAAADLGIPYDPAKLTNPQYNAALGAAYLAKQQQKYGNSGVGQQLALMAYHAGGGNVDSWIKQYGDPRSGKISWMSFQSQVKAAGNPASAAYTDQVAGNTPRGPQTVYQSSANPPGTPQKEEDIKYADMKMARIGEWQKKNDTAASILQTANRLKGMLDTGMTTGAGTETLAQIGNVLQSMGWTGDPKGIFQANSVAQFSAAKNKLVIDLLGGLGRQISDADRDYMDRILGRISDPTQAVQSILGYVGTAAALDQQRYEQGLADYKSGGDPMEFDVKFNKEHGIAYKPQPGSGQTDTAQASAVPADLPQGTVSAGKTKDGKNAYKLPDGSLVSD